MSASILLRKATPAQVRYACLNFHYAKSIPFPQVCFSCYEDEKFIGVIIYGSGASPAAARQFGVSQGESLELVRVALTKHIQPTSQYVAVSLKLLPKIKPFVKIVFSYADLSRQGHYGKIYQALNFMCLGKRTKSGACVMVVDGVETHPRKMNAVYGTIENARKYHEITEISGLTKILYVYCYDKQLRRELESKAISYQDIEGGAVPTSTL